MAESVVYFVVFFLKLFPSLICFDENADGGWKGGCMFVHSFCIGLA